MFWAKQKQIDVKFIENMEKCNRIIQLGGTGSDHLVQLPHQFRADWQICEPAEEVLWQIKTFEHQSKSFLVQMFLCDNKKLSVPMSYFTYFEIIEIVIFFQHFLFVATGLSSSQSLPFHLLTLSPKFRVALSQISPIHLFLLSKSLEGSGNTALAVEMLEGFILA